jgi:hypothetical protein
MKKSVGAPSNRLLVELCAIEQWDEDYYRQKPHDRIERDAHDNRQKRRAEIMLAILTLVPHRES